jgi:hypothetical protein
MSRRVYDSEGPGPVPTTDIDGNLPFAGGFNQGVRQGAYWGGDGGNYFTGYLTGIVLFFVAVLIGGPVFFRWSHYL